MNDEKDLPPKPKGLIGTRHRQACLMFFGLVVAYMQRVNLSVGIVAMTNQTVNPDFETVNYTTADKGFLSSVFFYGYMVAGTPAGILADKFGPIRLVSVIGGISCGLITIAIPFAALHMGLYYVAALRVIEGLGQGFFYPCLNAHISRWATPEERGQFTWVWTGAQLGTIIMLAMGGELAEGASGWPGIFYYSGVFGIIWGVSCFIFGYDSPAVHKSISEEEKQYIVSRSVSKKPGKLKVPWCSLLTSTPFLALIFSHLTQNWGFFTLLTLMPTYLSGVYHFEISENGLLSSLPYLGMLLAGMLFSYIADRMVGKYNTNFIRKFWNTVGFYGAGLALLVLALINMNSTWALTLLTIGTALNAGAFNGFTCNHVDLAPNFAGILMGTTNGLANIASIVAPRWATFIVSDETNEELWQTVFLVSAASFGLGNTVFLIFGSTELQPWNDISANVDTGAQNKGNNDMEMGNKAGPSDQNGSTTIAS
ncbi:Major Facilitator Superfamily [Nesidiocoris tenuis]|uniref:Major Facilitator Superfamily n=1 Tax=Nesidiocoris tenuis TaxID=355587 RepID=A0ABN7ALN8_9HEMI|nr:Major Facilitator Superfamily [Nesidiocoris tenuis]